MIDTCIIVDIQHGHYIQIAHPHPSTLTTWHTMQTIVDASTTNKIRIKITNTSPNHITIAKGQCIAQMLYQKVLVPRIKTKDAYTEDATISEQANIQEVSTPESDSL